MVFLFWTLWLCLITIFSFLFLRVGFKKEMKKILMFSKSIWLLAKASSIHFVAKGDDSV